MLVPLYSDWYYEALFSSLCSDCDFFPLASLYDASSSFFYSWISILFFHFGEVGIGVLYILLCVCCVLSFFIDFTARIVSDRDVGLAHVCLFLSLGALLYGQDLHPILFLVPFLVMQRLVVQRVCHADSLFGIFVWSLLSFLLYVLFRYIDIRSDVVMVFVLMLVGLERNDFSKRFKYALLFMCALFSLIYIISFDWAWFKNIPVYGALTSGVSFDYAFLYILFVLALITQAVRIRRPLFFFLCIFGLVFSHFSYLCKLCTVYFLCQNILVYKNGKQAERLELGLLVLRGKIQGISREGLVFFFSAACFVSLVSFFKNPVSDFIYPKALVDRYVEEEKCPSQYSDLIKGYLLFRFMHNRACIEDMIGKISMGETSTYCAEEGKKAGFISPEYCKLPDMWR